MAPSLSSDIAARLARINADIDTAARAAGRKPSEIKLIAVSKTQAADAVAAAIAGGQHRFGENTWQDAAPKIAAVIAPNIEWHFIGHLQSNKAKPVAQHFHWLHSLDRIDLAQKLARARIGTPLQALIEVNVAHDPRKSGCAPADVPLLIERLLRENLPALRLRGLMTIAPHTNDEAIVRASFARLRELAASLARDFGLTDFNELSMGMSGDFLPAIREGATFVRIGSAIFGERTAKSQT